MYELGAPPPLYAEIPDRYRAESVDMGSQAEPGNQEKLERALGRSMRRGKPAPKGSAKASEVSALC